MSFKTLTRKVSAKVSKQVLTVQYHSPVLLFGVGLVGVGTTTFLACRATLKLSEVLQKGEERLENAKNADQGTSDEEVQKATFGVQLHTAIKIARLYAPAVIVGVASVGALTQSHVILQRRNAGLTAALAIAHKGFSEYRARVIADQGAEKDLEYRFGVVEREIVEEGPNGPEVKTIKGLDQDAIKAGANMLYARIFDEYHDSWSKKKMDNQFFLQSMQNHANDMLRAKGMITLNDVYDLLGFKRTKAGQIVGWVYKPGKDPVTGIDRGDGYVDFGVWRNGIYHGKEWVTGNVDGILLDFNVDGGILDAFEEV